MQELGVPQCYSMTGEGVVAAAQGLGALRSLNLRGTALAEEHLISLIVLLPGLTHLQVCQSPLWCSWSRICWATPMHVCDMLVRV